MPTQCRQSKHAGPLVGKFRLTETAADHLQKILEFGFEQFGTNQALGYQDALIKIFELLGQNPLMGRPAEAKSGLRRHEHRRHVIFYRPNDDGVLIVAIYDNRSVRLPPNLR